MGMSNSKIAQLDTLGLSKALSKGKEGNLRNRADQTQDMISQKGLLSKERSALCKSIYL